MTITLLPITALLLLLSGMGGPVCGAGLHARGVVPGSGWFGPHHAVPAFRSAWGRPARPAALPKTPQPRAEARLQPAAKALHPASPRRKLYTTRFGFAEGAYLALGPPVPRSPALLA